ncbi:LOW QUALITY PROTEIN: SMC5-SMC6 complex localization factor protein 2 [Neosynchiropus ocellatus]
MLHETKSATVKDLVLKRTPLTPTSAFPETPVKLSQDSPLILPSFLRRMLPLQSPDQCNKKTTSTKPSCPLAMGSMLSTATSGDSPTDEAKKTNLESDVESARVWTLNGCSSSASHSVPQRKDLNKSCDRRDLPTQVSAGPNSGVHKSSAHRRDSTKDQKHTQPPSPRNKFIQGAHLRHSSQKRHSELADQTQGAKKKRLHFPNTGPASQSSDLSANFKSKDSKFSHELHLAKDSIQPQCGVKQMFSSSVPNSCIWISEKKQTLITERKALKENHGQKFKLEKSDEWTCKLSHPKSLTADRKKSSHKLRPLKYDEDELFKPDIVLRFERVKPASVDVITAPAAAVETSSANPMTSSHHNRTQSLSHKPNDFSANESTSAHTTKKSTAKALDLSNSVPYPSLKEIKCKDQVSAVDSGHKNNSDSSCEQVKDEKNDKPRKFKWDGDFQTSGDTLPVPPHSDVFENKSSAKEETAESDVDSIDFDLSLDVCSIQSSDSSDEEPLITLEEMMRGPIQPTKTKEEDAGPRSPGLESSQPSEELLPASTKSISYLNNLDQMLKDIHINKKAKDTEAELLTECAEGRLEIAEYEETKENQEGSMTAEQREFLQCFSLVTCTLNEVPPGENIFIVEKFGRLFNQDTLQLRKHTINPKGILQKIFVWSSAAQLRLYLNTGLLQEAYDSQCPCPTEVTLYLFKMMSVHTERMVSDNILRELCGLACTAARQTVQHGNQQFKVWVPSLAEVTLVVLNMGVDFVTLYPSESLQPQFTEGDLLDLVCGEGSSGTSEHKLFPLHNCDNVFKYLSVCLGLCPQVFSDTELLLLLTVASRIGLDSHYILQSKVELYALLYNILNNLREWDVMLPRICHALTDLTDHHHNMCLLVQLLPDSTRGRELSQHLSMSMISKLLDGTCVYRVTEREFQLADLCPYLPKMRPSSILKTKSESTTNDEIKADDHTHLEQESYYLCYSLLTLMNEVSNFQHFPSHQKGQLLILCRDLERHIKCDIRENKRCLYRSRVKDLVARISTKWQMHRRSSKPLNVQYIDKLYDYWLPIAMDQQACSIKEEDDMDGGEGSAMEEQPAGEESNSVVEQNEVDAQQEVPPSDEASDGAKSTACVGGDG